MADHLPGYSEWEETHYWGFGEEETRDTNVIMEKAAEKSVIELEKIPPISSVLEEIPIYSSTKLSLRSNLIKKTSAKFGTIQSVRSKY